MEGSSGSERPERRHRESQPDRNHPNSDHRLDPEELRDIAGAAPARKRQRSPDPTVITAEDLDVDRLMRRVPAGSLYPATLPGERSEIMAVRRSPSPERGPFEICDPERGHLLAAHDAVRSVETQLEVLDLRKNVAAAALLFLDESGTVIHQQGFIAVSGRPELYGEIEAPLGFERVDLAPDFTPLERSAAWIDIPGSGSHSGDRTLDSEYKLMARIAAYCGELGEEAPKTGRLIVASSYDACVSCQSVMVTFVQDRMRDARQDFALNFYSSQQNPSQRMAHFYDPREVFVRDHEDQRRTLFMSRIDGFLNMRAGRGARPREGSAGRFLPPNR